MKRSTERFLTTHTGSLPRPDDLVRMMFAKEEGVPVDPAALAARVCSAVAEVVRKQAEAGLDAINDGELSKPGYANYVKDRLSGFGGTSQALQLQDLLEFLDGLGVEAFLIVEDPQVVVREEVSGLERDDLLVLGHRLLDLALAVIGVPQVELGGDIFRIQLGRLAKLRYGLL